MAKQITKFVAEDGTEFLTEAAADKHDSLNRLLTLYTLDPIRFDFRNDYAQEETVEVPAPLLLSWLSNNRRFVQQVLDLL